MDPLSITASVIAVLQVAGSSGQALHKLLSLREAPQHLQQMWNEAEALKALLIETQSSLYRRHDFNGDTELEATIIRGLNTVKGHVLEYEKLICFRLTRNGALGHRGFPKVNRSHWLRASSEIQRIRQNIRDSRDILSTQLQLLALNESECVKSKVLQIQSISLTNQETIRELGKDQLETQQELRHFGECARKSLEQTQAFIECREPFIEASLDQMRFEQEQRFAALQASFTNSMQPLLSQVEQMTLAAKRTTPIRQPLIRNAQCHSQPNTLSQNGPAIRVSATIASQQCPSGCRCQCHLRTSVTSPRWFRSEFGQLLWTYNSSFSIRSCNYAPCRKSVNKHHFTYYFPPWLVSRAIVASANLGDVCGTGAKISINIPLVVPEEDHIVWLLVLAGNLDKLQELLSHDKNIVYVRNQWGQSIMHVAAKIHQPAIFNFLISIGMDPHLPDENQKTAATTVFTRRRSEEYGLKIDADDLADRLGWTPLHTAAALTREGRQIDEMLLESEHHDIDSKDALGRTPLHWLAENGDANAIQLLTQDPWRADVHTRDICGFTPLHCACWADSFDSAAALLEAGSNANARDKHQRTPLLHFDNRELLDLMILRGADVYISDDEGANIMHHAAVADQAGLAQPLLDQYGHTICVTNRDGDTPLGLAIRNNSLDLIAVLLPFMEHFPVEKIAAKNQNKRNILHLAALHASTEVMDMIAAARLLGLDTEARDKDLHTPNDCFLKCRNEHCAIARRSSVVERRSWIRLMTSTRMQSKSSLGVDSEDEETVVDLGDIHQNCKDCVSIGEISSGETSEDEYVDAVNSYDAKTSP